MKDVDGEDKENEEKGWLKKKFLNKIKESISKKKCEGFKDIVLEKKLKFKVKKFMVVESSEGIKKVKKIKKFVVKLSVSKIFFMGKKISEKGKDKIKVLKFKNIMKVKFKSKK